MRQGQITTFNIIYKFHLQNEPNIFPSRHTS